MAVWPEDIIITRDGYKETPPDNVIRSKMDVGPDKLRKRSSSNVRNISINLILTNELLEIFDAFYLENAPVAFAFPNPRNEEIVQARFKSIPSYNLNQTLWNVGVDLEILP